MISGVCKTCNKSMDREDLRPYGPGGSMICHKCAFATPEAKAQTEANFAALLGVKGPLTLTNNGPRPSTGPEIDQAARSLAREIKRNRRRPS